MSVINQSVEGLLSEGSRHERSAFEVHCCGLHDFRKDNQQVLQIGTTLNVSVNIIER